MVTAQDLFNGWLETSFEYGNLNGLNDDNYKERVKEVAVNCLSLSSTWFDNCNDEKVSFELVLKDNDMYEVKKLYGINRDNLPYLLLDYVTTKADQYSRAELYSFKYVEGKKESKKLGTLDIL